MSLFKRRFIALAAAAAVAAVLAGYGAAAAKDHEEYVEEIGCDFDCGDEEYADDPAPARAINVSNVKEFVAALGSDRIILLKPGRYRLPDGVKTDSNGDPVDPADGISWASGEALVFRGISNLVIRGAAGANMPELVIDTQVERVLQFVNCRGIVLDGIRAGHSKAAGDGCAYGVFMFENSSGITINNAAMYGSGTEGLELFNVSNMKVTNSRIYKCTSSIMSIYGGKDIALENCAFDNNKDSHLVNVYNGAQRISFVGCTFKDNAGGKMFNVSDGASVSVSRCVFSGNKLNAFITKSANVTFADCKLDNNTVTK